jgi:hypothetical protein
MSPDGPAGPDERDLGTEPPLSFVDGLPDWVSDALDAGSTNDWYDVDDEREQGNAVWSAFVRDVTATIEPDEQRRLLRTGRLAMRGRIDAWAP